VKKQKGVIGMIYEYNKEKSGYGNEVLYRMCAEFPKHKDLDVVKGKIWLIGRAYAVAIERNAGPDFNLVQGLNKVDNKLFSDLDQAIEDIKKYEYVSFDNLCDVLCLHERMVGLIKEVIRAGDGNESPGSKRSLASKYLHFHAPNMFFIFDSIAARNLNNVIREKGLRGRVNEYKGEYGKICVANKKCADVDQEYLGFVLKCLLYRKEVLKDEALSPRGIDMNLYPPEMY